MSSEESARIREVYRHYQEGDYYHRIWYERTPGNLFLNETVKKGVLKVLTKRGFATKLDRLRILEVGCGSGQILTYLIDFGAKEEFIFGIDIIEDRIKEAKAKMPSAHFQCGDASTLPYRDHSFDLVLQFTMLSSVLDERIRRKVTNEMLRILKPEGMILSFDTRYWNPQNPHTKPVSKKALRSYFDGYNVKCYSILLIPQIARFLARFSVPLCRQLERIPVFRSHYLATVQAST